MKFYICFNWLNNGVDLGCKASKNYKLPSATDLIFNVVYINRIAGGDEDLYHFTRTGDWRWVQRGAWPWDLFYHFKQDNLIEMSYKNMTVHFRIEIISFL